MPMSYDRLFERMKEKGISTYTLRQKKLVGEKTLSAMREGRPVRTDILARLCYILECQPGDIMEYIPDAADMKQNRASE